MLVTSIFSFPTIFSTSIFSFSLNVSKGPLLFNSEFCGQVKAKIPLMKAKHANLIETQQHTLNEVLFQIFYTTASHLCYLNYAPGKNTVNL